MPCGEMGALKISRGVWHWFEQASTCFQNAFKLEDTFFVNVSYLGNVAALTNDRRPSRICSDSSSPTRGTTGNCASAGVARPLQHTLTIVRNSNKKYKLYRVSSDAPESPNPLWGHCGRNPPHEHQTREGTNQQTQFRQETKNQQTHR